MRIRVDHSEAKELKLVGLGVRASTQFGGDFSLTPQAARLYKWPVFCRADVRDLV